MPGDGEGACQAPGATSVGGTRAPVQAQEQSREGLSRASEIGKGEAGLLGGEESTEGN